MWWESWRTNRFARAEHIYDSSRKNGSNQFLAHSPSVASYKSAPKFDSIAKLTQQGYKWTDNLITKIPGSSSPEAQQRMQRMKENGNWGMVFSVNKGWCQDLLVWSGGSQHCYCLCNIFPRITQEISVSKRVCLISFSSFHVFCKKNPPPTPVHHASDIYKVQQPKPFCPFFLCVYVWVYRKSSKRNQIKKCIANYQIYIN